MNHLNTLFQLVKMASSVRDITKESRSYHFAVTHPLTFYLRAEYALIEITRWQRPLIEVTVQLQMPMGWRVATDQDEAGVYMALARKTVVGGLSGAVIQVAVPYDTHLAFRLEQSSLKFYNVNGTLEFPAIQLKKETLIQSQNGGLLDA